MIAGRKLLLADDSIAIQKVVDLTFTDEGMKVETVGDGQDALDKLSQFQPDVVLADVYMPGVDGYELCKFIKQNERFSRIPVMLLIGSFEPFDQSEAERAGADDVVTKPFQSIRQLVSRVGSLLGSESASDQESASKYSTLGLTAEEKPEAPTSVEHESIVEPESRADVPVFVEAAVMEDTTEVSEHHCPPELEIQTADTRELHPIDAPVVEDDTIEVEPVDASEYGVAEMAESARPEQELSFTASRSESFVAPKSNQGAVFAGSVLDLGDVDSPVRTEPSDVFVWDLDFESEAPASIAKDAPREREEMASIPAPVEEIGEAMPSESEVQMISQPAATSVPEPEPILAEARREETGESTPSEANAGTLSPEAIDAISRRVVEQLSENVVREIAWEVVPELSELLIKQRLDQK